MAHSLSRRIDKLQRLETVFRIRLRKTQTARLVLAALFCIIAFVSILRPAPSLEISALFVIVAVFSYLVIRSRSLSRHANRLGRLASFYNRQNQRQKGESVERSWQKALDSLGATADHTLIEDLNLIGPHSLFTLLDETVSDGGRALLAQWMSTNPFAQDEVLHQQQLIGELTRERWPYIRLSILSSELNIELSTQDSLQTLNQAFLPNHGSKWLVIGILGWLVAIAGIYWSVSTHILSPAFFIVGFILLSFIALNQVGPVFLKGLGLANHLSTLAALFQLLERRPQSSPMRVLMPRTFATRPSRQLKGFQRILDFLSIEAHPIIYLVLNSLAPWTLFFSWLLERERRKMSEDFPICLQEFNKLEASMSLSLLSIYQKTHFPTVLSHSTLLLKGAFHPLIKRSHVVANDFSFEPGQTLGLLTGSNMSGKSTFLRTIGINQTLANMGAPVFATKMETTVFRIGSCIQVSDSLRDGFSYFYSEVLRLKRLIDQVHSDESVLFLIDEIFRGTNNLERQIGSRAVIRSLLYPKSYGFVSTHDLELTKLDKTLPEIVNLHFREEIRDGEMHFSYQLKQGPCPTTNALVIMEQAGLDLRELHQPL